MEQFPKCQQCKAGDLVPLSDFGGHGAPIHYKAWVCTNPGCGFNIKIRNGEIFVNCESLQTPMSFSQRSR